MVLVCESGICAYLVLGVEDIAVVGCWAVCILNGVLYVSTADVSVPGVLDYGMMYGVHTVQYDLKGCAVRSFGSSRSFGGCTSGTVVEHGPGDLDVGPLGADMLPTGTRGPEPPYCIPDAYSVEVVHR